MSGRIGKIDAHDVQTPLSLRGPAHQKQSLIAVAAMLKMVATLASDIPIPAHSNVVLYVAVE